MDYVTITTPNRRLRRTILSIKNKGGVGGSHLTIATATLLRMSANGAFTTVLVDLDGSTGTTISKMGERDADGTIREEQSLENGVPAIDLFDPDQRGQLLPLTQIDDRFLILDGPAASLNTFRALTENLDASDFAQANADAGRDLVVMIPITPHLASIAAVPDAIEMFGDQAKYVVVRSMLGYKPNDYVLWDSPEFCDKFGKVVSGRSKAMLADVGGIVLDMPTLTPKVLARAEALKVPFSEALNSPLLALDEQLSVRKWLNAWAGQLDLIRDALGLDASFAWNVA